MQNFDEDGNVLNIDYLLRQVNENIDDRDMLDVMLLLQAAAMLENSSDLKIDLYGQVLYTAMKQEQRPEELGQWLDNAIYLARQRLIARIDQLNLPVDPDSDPLGTIAQVYGSGSKLYKKHNLESCRVSQIYFYYSLFNIDRASWEDEDNAKSLTVGIGITAVEFAFRAGCYLECLSIAQHSFEIYKSMDANRWSMFPPEEIKMMKAGLFLLCFWSYKSAMQIGQYKQASAWAVKGETYVDLLEDAHMKSQYYIKRGEILIELGEAEEALIWLEKSLEVPGLTPQEIEDVKRQVEGAKHTIEGRVDRLLNAAFGDILKEKDKKFLKEVFESATTGNLRPDEFSRAVDLLELFLSSDSLEQHTALKAMKAEFSKFKEQLTVQFARAAMETGDTDFVEKVIPQIEQLAAGDSQYKLDAAFFLLRLREEGGEIITWHLLEPLVMQLLERFRGDLTGELKDLVAILTGFDKEEFRKASTAMAKLFQKIVFADEHERTPLALSQETAISMDILEGLLSVSAMMSEADPDHEQWWLENVSRIKYLFSYRAQRMQKESMLFKFDTELPGDTARQIRVLAKELTRKNCDYRETVMKKGREEEIRLMTLLYPLYHQYRPLLEKWEYRYPELVHIETAAYMKSEGYRGQVISVGYHNGSWRATRPDTEIERTDARSYLATIKYNRPFQEQHIEIGLRLRKALLPLSDESRLPALLGVRSSGIYHSIPLDALPLSVDEKPGPVTQWVGEQMVTALLTGPNSDLAILEETLDIKKIAMFANSVFNSERFKDLHGMSEEVKAVEKIVKANTGVAPEIFLDSDSNRKNFLQLSGGNAPQIIHIATHGFSPIQDPQGSYLIFSREDANGTPILKAVGYHDIMLMDLRQCDLVILSACSTHEGQEILGEGIMGLAWAFKAAGAKVVIGSRWRVLHKAAIEFWKIFYENVCKGIPIGAAFQEARRNIIENKQLSHPHFWGVFQVIV